jgi:hypothetical protein
MSESLAPTRARHKVSNSSKNTKWTQAEDTHLTNLMRMAPEVQWTDLLAEFPGKTTQQVAERWEKVLNPNLVKGSWSRDEDETIIAFVRQHGRKKWTKLAALLPGRIGKQCRERWRNHLDPEVNREPWTAQEDEILIEQHELMGNQWVKLAEYLPGRSDNAVKNRWNSTLQKNLVAIRTGTPRKRRGRPPRGSLPKSADDIPKPPKLAEIVNEVEAKSAAIGWYSPMTTLRSPFPGFRELFAERSPDRGVDFGPLSPLQGADRAFASPMPFSLNLLSPKGENSGDTMNFLAPEPKK